MADREEDDWSNHPVGFKRPPPWGQFRKGRSGNPKGRPRKKDKKTTARQPAQLTEFEQLESELLGEEVMLTLGGSKVPVSKKRAILLNLFKQAMGGQPLAMRELNRIIEKVEAKEEAQARVEAEAAEQALQERLRKDEAWFQYLLDLRARQASVWERAVLACQSEPDEPWPHPDDILLDHVTRTGRVRGPIGEADVAPWDHLRRSRDHHLVRMIFHLRRGERIHRLISRMWLVNLVECDVCLPKRWQISYDITPVSLPLMAMLPRQLEALVQRGALEFEAGSRDVFRSKEVYQQANRKWRLLIKMLGFRSLRHLEAAGDQDSR